MSDTLEQNSLGYVDLSGTVPGDVAVGAPLFSSVLASLKEQFPNQPPQELVPLVVQTIRDLSTPIGPTASDKIEREKEQFELDKKRKDDDEERERRIKDEDEQRKIRTLDDEEARELRRKDDEERRIQDRSALEATARKEQDDARHQRRLKFYGITNKGPILLVGFFLSVIFLLFCGYLLNLRVSSVESDEIPAYMIIASFIGSLFIGTASLGLKAASLRSWLSIVGADTK